MNKQEPLVQETSETKQSIIVSGWNEYFDKCCYNKRCDVKRPSASECFWTFVGIFVGMGIITFLTYSKNIPVLVASLGASACLIYGYPSAPFSQPRNVVLGQMVSALAGTAVFQAFGSVWYSAALAVALAVLAMMFTRTVHPPAAATALIAVVTGQSWLFMIFPVAIGSSILVAGGFLVNNLAKKRQYPQYWY
jgi:CBS-domain-containing membrane protein